MVSINPFHAVSQYIVQNCIELQEIQWWRGIEWVTGYISGIHIYRILGPTQTLVQMTYSIIFV